MKDYKIGEVAKLLGLTTQALRFYEKEGVVKPRKSENGTRYYAFEELHKLLSFKKYRMAEFTVQDIVGHLQTNTLQTLSDQLDDKSDELIARSEELLRRAQALRQFRHEVDEASRSIDVLSECMRPELYLQTMVLNELDGLLPREKEEISAYIEALPATSIAFTQDAALKKQMEFCMCVSGERAQRWGLSLKHTRLLVPTRCITTVVRISHLHHIIEMINDVIARVKGEGYTINLCEEILSLHIASDVHDGVTKTCARLYIPIL